MRVTTDKNMRLTPKMTTPRPREIEYVFQKRRTERAFCKVQQQDGRGEAWLKINAQNLKRVERMTEREVVTVVQRAKGKKGRPRGEKREKKEDKKTKRGTTPNCKTEQTANQEIGATATANQQVVKTTNLYTLREEGGECRGRLNVKINKTLVGIRKRKGRRGEHGPQGGGMTWIKSREEEERVDTQSTRVEGCNKPNPQITRK